MPHFDTATLLYCVMAFGALHAAAFIALYRIYRCEIEANNDNLR